MMPILGSQVDPHDTERHLGRWSVKDNNGVSFYKTNMVRKDIDWWIKVAEPEYSLCYYAANQAWYTKRNRSKRLLKSFDGNLSSPVLATMLTVNLLTHSTRRLCRQRTCAVPHISHFLSHSWNCTIRSAGQCHSHDTIRLHSLCWCNSYLCLLTLSVFLLVEVASLVPANNIICRF